MHLSATLKHKRPEHQLPRPAVWPLQPHLRTRLHLSLQAVKGGDRRPSSGLSLDQSSRMNRLCRIILRSVLSMLCYRQKTLRLQHNCQQQRSNEMPNSISHESIEPSTQDFSRLERQNQTRKSCCLAKELLSSPNHLYRQGPPRPSSAIFPLTSRRPLSPYPPLCSDA